MSMSHLWFEYVRIDSYFAVTRANIPMRTAAGWLGPVFGRFTTHTYMHEQPASVLFCLGWGTGQMVYEVKR